MAKKASRKSELLAHRKKLDARKRVLPNFLDKAFSLHIELLGTEPKVWRKVETLDCDLDELHRVIQCAMGWQNEHLYGFRVGKTDYMPPDDGFAMYTSSTKSTSDTRLSDLALAGVRKLQYTYDFGDSWEHAIKLSTIDPVPEVVYPRCIDGANACPPEDSGGVWGYGDKLEVLKAPDSDDYEDVVGWLGEDFDPSAFSLEEVNQMLSRLSRET